MGVKGSLIVPAKLAAMHVIYSFKYI